MLHLTCPMDIPHAVAYYIPGDLGCIFMTLVAMQTGIQPAVTRACVSETVSAQSLVIAEMMVSVILALAVIPTDNFSEWSMFDSLKLAGPPSVMYALRSLFKQSAYRRCDGVTFNVLNQTKVVFCAIAAWLIMGERQTVQQCGALLCAVVAGGLLVIPGQVSAEKLPTRPAVSQDKFSGQMSPGRKASVPGQAKSRGKASRLLVVEANSDGSTCDGSSKYFSKYFGSRDYTVNSSHVLLGVALALSTAACSGVAAAMSQSAMKMATRPSALFNLELSLWGVPFVLLSGGGLRPFSALHGWHRYTLVPVALQAAGGLLVSAVVKRHGGVAMGLCTVAGITVSALVDMITTRRPPSMRQVCAAALCALSVAMHQSDYSRHPTAAVKTYQHETRQ